MTTIDKKRVARTAAISRFSSLVVKYLYHTDWTLSADACGVTEILDSASHERVRRAQSFGDDDYAYAISRFLIEVFDTDEQIGLLLIHTIIQQRSSDEGDLVPQAKSELEQILNMLGGQNSDITSLIQGFHPTTTSKFIETTWIPDDFYKRLIDEINLLYSTKLVLSLFILIRKLFENLIIDILRRRYGTQNIGYFYDTSRRRFYDFSVVLNNFELNIADFHYIVPNLDRSITQRINRFRETGNSAAHSIDDNISIDQITTEKENINYLVQYLLRILQNI